MKISRNIVESDEINIIIFYLSQIFFSLSEIFDGPCTFDYLQLRDKDYKGEELGKHCGNKVPQPIVSSSNALWISMVTDGEDNRAGFRYQLNTTSYILYNRARNVR